VHCRVSDTHSETGEYGLRFLEIPCQKNHWRQRKSLRYLKSEAAPVVAFMEVISDAIQADKATRAFGLSQPAGK